jgi:DNA-binding LytR/AlgR family response regulator
MKTTLTNNYDRQTVENLSESSNTKKFIAFQTLIGLKFVQKESIVFFQYGCNGHTNKNFWIANLINSETLKLKTNITSKDILAHFGDNNFVQINQNVIINLNNLDSIELKSRKCILTYNGNIREFIISRNFLREIREIYEMDYRINA